jgi:MFS transporter, OFA family, oxalate/formate antiporter
MGNFPGRTTVEEPVTPTIMAHAVPIVRRERIFYGWIVVVATFTVLFIAYGIQFSFGVFMHYISLDTGWDRGSLSLPYSLYVFVYSALGFASGRLTDRYGPRRVLTIGGCLLGGGVMLTGSAHMLWQFYIALGLFAACGMSAAYVPCNATVVRWFTIRRGLALGLTSSGTSLGMFVFPPIATALIAVCGWRHAYSILGLLALVTIILCARFIVRDPEQMGLHPDGDEPRRHHTFDRLADQRPEAVWTLGSAQQTVAFWVLTAIFTLTWLVVFMPMVHIVPFAIDLGIPQFRAAMTISMIGLAGFVGRLVIGPISDRAGRLVSLGVCLILQALAFIGFALSRELFLLYLSAGLFGLSYGGVTALFPALIGDYFGRIAVGAIVGFIFAVAGAPAAFGPLIAGYLFDFTGSYRLAFELSAILNLLALSLIFSLRKPQLASA